MEESKSYLKYLRDNLKSCKIISSFSCLGKTYTALKYENILDLEASWYKWIYNDSEIAKDVEKRKGVTDRRINPEYPANYFKAINENIDKYDIIFITPEKHIRQLLTEYNVDYFYAFPTNSKFVVNRALLRGNNVYFSLGLEKTYEKWAPDPNEKILWVRENEYLENVLKTENIL